MKGASQGDGERIVLIFRWCQLAAEPFSLTCLSSFSCPDTLRLWQQPRGLRFSEELGGDAPSGGRQKVLRNALLASAWLCRSRVFLRPLISYSHILGSRREGGSSWLVHNRVSGDGAAVWAADGRRKIHKPTCLSAE